MSAINKDVAQPVPLPSDDKPKPLVSDETLAREIRMRDTMQHQKQIAKELQQWRKWAAALPVE